jgi:hypothetical protein
MNRPDADAQLCGDSLRVQHSSGPSQTFALWRTSLVLSLLVLFARC